MMEREIYSFNYDDLEAKLLNLKSQSFSDMNQEDFFGRIPFITEDSLANSSETADTKEAKMGNEIQEDLHSIQKNNINRPTFKIHQLDRR
jgi:hypothetical protein